ncbi:MAG: cation transporter [Deltaproteobacteria bacterium]|nr:cation transporter [Candidatus Zymogenaceae bacterium]
MAFLDGVNRGVAKRLIPDFDNTKNKNVRLRYGLVAGLSSIIATIILFVVKLVLGIMADSVSVIADAFHLLSHVANSIVLVASFIIASRPATEKTPFGHGRMEHIAPLVMSIFLLVIGIQVGEAAVHQIAEPHEVHYWNALPWILGATIVVKQFLYRFIRYLGERIHSHSILANAAHQLIEAVITLAVIAGLVAGHIFHVSAIDGYLGAVVALWLMYLGFAHAKEALVPLLGQAPSPEMIDRIRKAATDVDGVEGVHEIIVHDYGSFSLVSLHAEMPEKFSTRRMHGTAERVERRLAEEFGGDAVCHADPLMERTPEIKALEERFARIVDGMEDVAGFHGFRVVGTGDDKIIIVADIDAALSVPEMKYGELAASLEKEVKRQIEHVEYCTFSVTPKYAF